MHRWRRWLIAFVVSIGFGLAASAIAWAVGSKSAKPTTAALLEACLPGFHAYIPATRVPIAQVHVLLAMGTPADPTVDIAVTPANRGFYCDHGRGFGPFDLVGRGSAEPASSSSPSGAFRVMYPLWIGDICSTRAWMILARAPADVVEIQANTNSGVVEVHPFRGLFAVYVHQHITPSRTFSPSPFGELIGYGSGGQVVASATLLPGSDAYTDPVNNRPR
jgi:hypothetical protein